MTPIKAFLIYGLQIWCVDFADQAQLVCVAADEAQRDFLAYSLREAHKRPVVLSESPIHTVRVSWPTGHPKEEDGGV